MKHIDIKPLRSDTCRPSECVSICNSGNTSYKYSCISDTRCIITGSPQRDGYMCLLFDLDMGLAPTPVYSLRKEETVFLRDYIPSMYDKDWSSAVDSTCHARHRALVDGRGPRACTHSRCGCARPVFHLLTRVSMCWDLDERGSRPAVVVVDTRCSSFDVCRSHPTHRAYAAHVHLVHLHTTMWYIPEDVKCVVNYGAR
jgi:hypothetical protein